MRLDSFIINFSEFQQLRTIYAKYIACCAFDGFQFSTIYTNTNNFDFFLARPFGNYFVLYISCR